MAARSRPEEGPKDRLIESFSGCHCETLGVSPCVEVVDCVLCALGALGEP